MAPSYASSEGWHGQSRVAAVLLMVIADGGAQLELIRAAIRREDHEAAWKSVRMWQARCGHLDFWSLFDRLDELGSCLYDGAPFVRAMSALEQLWVMLDRRLLMAVRVCSAGDRAFPDRFVREMPGGDMWRTTHRAFPWWSPEALA